MGVEQVWLCFSPVFYFWHGCFATLAPAQLVNINASWHSDRDWSWHVVTVWWKVFWDDVAGVFLLSKERWKADCGFCAVLCAICASLWLHTWLFSSCIVCRSLYLVWSCFRFISAMLQTLHLNGVYMNLDSNYCILLPVDNCYCFQG